MSRVVIASILLAYACLGRADVRAALRTSVLKKPFWALQPTWTNKLLNGSLWPAGHLARAYFVHPSIRVRSVTSAIFAIAASWAFVSLVIFLGFEAAADFGDSNFSRVLAYIVAWNVALGVAKLVSPARRTFPREPPPSRLSA